MGEDFVLFSDGVIANPARQDPVAHIRANAVANGAASPTDDAVRNSHVVAVANIDSEPGHVILYLSRCQIG